MNHAKIETQVNSTMGGDVSTGDSETVVLSKDEQHLASLGYKQGVHFMLKAERYISNILLVH